MGYRCFDYSTIGKHDNFKRAGYPTEKKCDKIIKRFQVISIHRKQVYVKKMDKKQTVSATLALWLLPLQIIFLIVSYFLIEEVFVVMMVLVGASLLGVLLGLIGLIVALIRKNRKKRGAVWSIALHLLIIFLVVLAFVIIMSSGN